MTSLNTADNTQTTAIACHNFMPALFISVPHYLQRTLLTQSGL